MEVSGPIVRNSILGLCPPHVQYNPRDDNGELQQCCNRCNIVIVMDDAVNVKAK